MLKMHVGGEFVESGNRRVLPVMDPFLGAEVASIPDASGEDVDAAIGAAAAAGLTGA